LAVPIALSLAGAWVTARFQEQNRQNETVNKYFEQIEKLVIDKNINLSKASNPIKTLIKARSLATLGGIDLKRQEIIISFLSESNLLNYKRDGISLSYFNLSETKFFFWKSGINLSGLDLTGIDLRNTFLFQANLKGANLEEANLERANLKEADIERANLKEADIEGANLIEANLIEADLNRANLESANLESANLVVADLHRAFLRGANLNGANLNGANLKGAVLSEADNLTNEQIKSACFWDEAI
jgi:uncharacterized protein YjbI with pentapeptide repeats